MFCQCHKMPPRRLLKASNPLRMEMVRNSSQLQHIFVSRLRAIFGPNFFKKISSSTTWLCHCFLRQSVLITAQKCQSISSGYYLSIFSCLKSRFYSRNRTFSPAFLAAFSPMILSAASHDSNEDSFINDEIMASHSRYVKMLEVSIFLSCQIIIIKRLNQI